MNQEPNNQPNPELNNGGVSNSLGSEAPFNPLVNPEPSVSNPEPSVTPDLSGNNSSMNSVPNQNVNVNPGMSEVPINSFVNPEPSVSNPEPSVTPDLGINNSSMGSTPVQNMVGNPEPQLVNVTSPQPEPNFSNPNSNGNNLTPSKKKNSILIAVIIVIVVILVGVVIGIMLKKPSNSGTGSQSSGGNTQMGIAIKQISVTDKTIVALDNNGNLYYIGDGSNADDIYKDNENHNTIKKIASNVEKFNMGMAIYYINNDHDLYFLGGSYNAGSSKEFTHDESGVNDINTYMNFCGYAIKNDNELYVKNNNFTKSYCGLNKEYYEFTKIASNVKETIVDMNYGGYITDNNEFYFSKSDSNFVKLLDNVKSVISVGYFQILILTNDNKLYVYTKGETDYTLTLLREDVIELKNNYFKTSNNDYYIFSEHSGLSLINGKSELLSDKDDRRLYSGILKVNDIKDIIYYISSEFYAFDDVKDKMVYISNSGKLVLLDENNKTELDYNSDNLKKIYDFVTTNK